PLGADAQYQVLTPTTIAVVHGTAFQVRVKPDGATDVHTTDGVVQTRAQGAVGTVDVPAGQVTTVQSRTAPPSAARADPFPILTFILEATRNSVVVDTTGKSSGIKDGQIVRYIGQSTVTEKDDKVTIKIPGD